ncbi:hypothetical protein [Halosimplex salinum]|uniref:hypothetical protein n=1 Tax=Halosimplex salinum TaxID=1710538 RepID=UPI000F47B5A8|nr:hypothetical protein [Halosimplex salinum]
MNSSVGRLRATSGEDVADTDSRSAGTVEVTDVRATGTTVECTIDYSKDLSPFFDESPFYVEYDVDVSDVPESILTIPVLAQVCPVAWAAGADVYAPVVDRRFLESLEAVGSALHEMYPFMQGGRVVVEEAAEWDGDESDAEGTGLLFTGGVDSLSAYVRHRDEDPTLINIQGWLVGIDDDERWAHTKSRIDGYADRFGAETQFVRSNMLEFLDTAMLEASYKRYHDGCWYSAVGCGLGLLGLCAPLAAAEGYGTLYITATHWEEFPIPDEYDYWDGPSIPWGSDPTIDDEVAWGSTQAHHDAFALTRQDRLQVVADYAREYDPDLPVRACEASETGSNCNHCEKCLRTAFGLALAGVDPNDHGFDVDRSSFERARADIEAGNWLLDYHHEAYWLDLQDHIDGDVDLSTEGAQAFAEWFRTADVESYAERSSPPVHQRALRAVARSTPYPVYNRLYPVYDSVQNYVGGK